MAFSVCAVLAASAPSRASGAFSGGVAASPTLRSGFLSAPPAPKVARPQRAVEFSVAASSEASSAEAANALGRRAFAAALAAAAGAVAAQRPALAADAELSEADLDAADALFDKMIGYQKDFQFKEAREAAIELQKNYPDSPLASVAGKMQVGYEAVGRQVGPVVLAKWIQGEEIWEGWAADSKLARKEKRVYPGVTVVLFFEEWCPHCRREMPEMSRRFERLRDKGLRVLGLTQITAPSTEELVEKFLAENSISFPVAQEDARLSKRFGVKGIPAAALVKDGIIEWRGHPKMVEDAIKRYIDV
eukprot:tig00020684_g12865.t1